MTEDLAKESIKDAINEELTTEVLKAEENDVPFYGINIMTDARHDWRRNAAQSDVVAIGQTHHRVVGLAVVTRQDDPVSQRHEIRGVENLYQHFDENDTSINIHGHDRNASVNKYLAVHQPQVTNASGPQKYMGVTWHPHLSD